MTKIEILEAAYNNAVLYLKGCLEEAEIARRVTIDAYHNLDAALKEEIARKQGEAE